MILIEKTLYLHVSKLKIYLMENKDLNRLKVMLAEKNAAINGLPNN